MLLDICWISHASIAVITSTGSGDSDEFVHMLQICSVELRPFHH